MQRLNFFSFLLLPAVVLLSACVGPSSPFGALNFGTGDGFESNIKSAKDDFDKKVNFSPKRQVLHKTENLKVVINNDSSDVALKDVDIRVIYNKRDVTHAFRRYLRVSNTDENQVVLAYNNLRLLPSKYHDIQFYYSSDGGGEYVRASYLPPQCLLFEAKEIKSTAPFNVRKEDLSSISDQADKYKLNANLIAGLIAQESGFNPSAVSRASAVGLTQITDLAANEIEEFKPAWKVLRNEDKDLDWREDPVKAIEGGAIYIQFLSKYWTEESAAQLLQKYNITDMGPIILASYNSGAARVKKNVVENGEKWLDQPNLKEAFRYVNNVTSYCYHFAGGSE